ncbi:MAG: SRPBCC family protein [Planctomycetota bacterium]|jgi:uncharacterized protein YndB with AHSA1/START domain
MKLHPSGGAVNADHDAPRDRRPSVEDVRLTWSFEAPAHRLFEAWSDADQYRRWAWGQLGSGTEATVECRVGGQYRVSTKRPDGGAWSFWGEFLECVPNERLVYTVNWTAPMGYESSGETVEVVFRQSDRGTDIEFVHKGVPSQEAREEHRKGWADTLQTLSKMLAGRDAGDASSRDANQEAGQ